jgi:hypothetical protein
VQSRFSEVWLPIVGYPKYEVNSEGNIRNAKTKVVEKLNIYPQKSHLTVYLLNKFDKPKLENVGCCICRAFWPNPKYLPIVQDIDDNVKNNHTNNLRWASKEEMDIANSYIIRYK